MPPHNRSITSPSRRYAITAAPAEKARPAPPTSFPLRLRALQGSVACGGRRSRPWWARRTERGLSTSWLLSQGPAETPGHSLYEHQAEAARRRNAVSCAPAAWAEPPPPKATGAAAQRRRVPAGGGASERVTAGRPAATGTGTAAARAPQRPAPRLWPVGRVRAKAMKTRVRPLPDAS